jgi:hypothetical protein
MCPLRPKQPCPPAWRRSRPSHPAGGGNRPIRSPPLSTRAGSRCATSTDGSGLFN